jgi:geranylgeranyl reductase family protein
MPGSTAQDIEADVVVAGAGPSGASASLWLATAGWRVVVLEKKRFPRDKTCGDGLTPRALAQLRDMGVDLGPDSGCHRYVGLRVRAFSKALEMPWPKVPGMPDYGVTITRRALDHLVAAKAAQTGAKLLEEHEVTRVILDEKGRFKGVLVKAARDGEDGLLRVRARYLVVADGSNSRLARALGARRDERYPLGLAARTYFRSELADDPFIESHLDLATDKGVIPGYGWVFPLGGGLLNVGAGLLNTSERWKGVNTGKLVSLLVERAGPIWGFGPSDQVGAVWGGKLPMGLCIRPRIGPGWCLVGDALGSINPFNGEGISYAMETGRLAAHYVDRALREDKVPSKGIEPALRDYEGDLIERYRRYYDLGSVFVAAISNPRLLKACLGLGFRVPRLMDWALAIMANLFNPVDPGPPEVLTRIAGAVASRLSGLPKEETDGAQHPLLGLAIDDGPSSLEGSAPAVREGRLSPPR